MNPKLSTLDPKPQPLNRHARWFAGRMIAAEYQFMKLYDAHFGL